MTLTLTFQGQICNLLYLSQKWSDCPETKCKHINWTLGFKCDHRFWPWPCTWPWIFKVKYRICYISAKNGPLATKQKVNISIEFQASNVTNGIDLDHNLDIWIFKVKRDLDLWPHTWPLPWIFMVKFWNSCISEWEGWLTLHKEGGSRSFMTMTMTMTLLVTKVRCMDLPDSDRGHFSCQRAVDSSSYKCSFSVLLGVFQLCAPKAPFLVLELKLQRSMSGLLCLNVFDLMMIMSWTTNIIPNKVDKWCTEHLSPDIHTKSVTSAGFDCPVWALYGTRMVWNTLRSPVRGPYNAYAGVAWGLC